MDVLQHARDVREPALPAGAPAERPRPRPRARRRADRVLPPGYGSRDWPDALAARKTLGRRGGIPRGVLHSHALDLRGPAGVAHRRRRLHLGARPRHRPGTLALGDLEPLAHRPLAVGALADRGRGSGARLRAQGVAGLRAQGRSFRRGGRFRPSCGRAASGRFPRTCRRPCFTRAISSC